MTAESLEAFVAGIFRAVGAEEAVAAEVAHHLVDAELSGHDSHGILRVARYVNSCETGVLHPGAHPVVMRERGTGALIDAQRSFGIYSTRFALDWVLDAARAHGIGAAAIRHSTHIGRLGAYTERAAAQGMIGIVTLGFAGPGLGNVVPFGGKRGFLSTNPWSIGFPSASGPPMIYDAATSAIPEGKVMAAKLKGVQLPPGTIVDRDGNPTTNPQDHYDGGSLLSLGGELFGHKGFGLGLAAAMMGGLAIIDDPAPVLPVGSARTPDPHGLMAGVFVLALDPDLFGERDRYAQLVADNLSALRAQEPARGSARVVAPGEPEARSREARLRDGIEIPAPIWDELTALGKRLGVEPPVSSSPH
jgi:hydroxycarboxylate dehydrogenase B